MATGKSLEELPARMMLCVAYAAMLDIATTNTEDVQKARDAFEKSFRDAAWERETGLPAIAMTIPPADGPLDPMGPLPE